MSEAVQMESKTMSDSQALEILKGLQGETVVTVPLVVNGQKVHDGIKFRITTTAHNDFLNASQSGKISATAAAKNYLMSIVDEKHQTILGEALKVVGMINFMMEKVTGDALPTIGDTLD